MSIDPRKQADLLSASRPAAEAFVEDIAYIRALLDKRDWGRHEIRHLSAILRRLLIDNGGDLRLIAPQRIGALKLSAPDNTWFYQTSKNYFIVWFISGGIKVHENPFRGVLVTQPELRKPSDFDEDKTVELNLDGFLRQKVLALQGSWIHRADVIKFMANVGSGVHSGKIKEETEKLIARMRRCLSITHAGDTAIKIEVDTLALQFGLTTYKHTPNSIDLVLIEILAAARFLANSPSIVRLESLVKNELAAFE